MADLIKYTYLPKDLMADGSPSIKETNAVHPE